jgi:hypothetical protein
LIVLTTIILCIKSYIFISFENSIEHAIMFPLHSITYPTYDHGIDYHTHQPLLHNFTRINPTNVFGQIKVVTRSVEKYFSYKLARGFTHKDMLVQI